MYTAMGTVRLRDRTLELTVTTLSVRMLFCGSDDENSGRDNIAGSSQIVQEDLIGPACSGRVDALKTLWASNLARDLHPMIIRCKKSENYVTDGRNS